MACGVGAGVPTTVDRNQPPRLSTARPAHALPHVQRLAQRRGAHPPTHPRRRAGHRKRGHPRQTRPRHCSTLARNPPRMGNVARRRQRLRTCPLPAVRTLAGRPASMCPLTLARARRRRHRFRHFTELRGLGHATGHATPPPCPHAAPDLGHFRRNPRPAFLVGVLARVVAPARITIALRSLGRRGRPSQLLF